MRRTKREGGWESADQMLRGDRFHGERAARTGTGYGGEIAGEDLPDPAPGSVVLHRDDAGELYGIEIYGGAGKRLDLDQIELQRVPAGSTEGSEAETRTAKR